MRRGLAPGRLLNELPAYLHVLINHQRSPRGEIKLSISLCLLPPASPRRTAPHPATPLPSHCPRSSASAQDSVHHCCCRSPDGEGNGNIPAAICTGHKLSLEKHDVVGNGAFHQPCHLPAKCPTGRQNSIYYPCPGPMGGQASLLSSWLGFGAATGNVWGVRSTTLDGGCNCLNPSRATVPQGRWL